MADAWAQAAAQRGWQYQPEDPTVGGLFRCVDGTRVLHVLRGVHDGRHFIAFCRESESSWIDPNGMTMSDTTRTRYVAVDLGAVVPDFEVTPQNFVTRLFRRRGAIPTGHPGFDHANTVHSASPEFAADLLSGILPVLLQWRPVPWRLEGRSLVVQGDERGIAPIDEMLAFAGSVIGAIPERVWSRLL